MEPKPRVCVVDDDDAVCTVTCRILEASGEFRCSGFTSPVEFLEVLLEEPADCVITDLKMPQVDGAELLARVRTADPLVSVVVITAYADVATAVRLMEMGSYTVLEKPFQPDALIEKVRAATQTTLSLRRAQQQLQDIRDRLASLTEEEHKILECMTAGMPNKTIALNLSLSSRTLDRRRHDILRKMQVDSAPELAKLVERAYHMARAQE